MKKRVVYLTRDKHSPSDSTECNIHFAKPAAVREEETDVYWEYQHQGDYSVPTEAIEALFGIKLKRGEGPVEMMVTSEVRKRPKYEEDIQPDQNPPAGQG